MSKSNPYDPFINNEGLFRSLYPRDRLILDEIILVISSPIQIRAFSIEEISNLTGFTPDELSPVIETLVAKRFLISRNNKYLLIHEAFKDIARLRWERLREITKKFLKDLVEEDRPIFQQLFSIRGDRPALKEIVNQINLPYEKIVHIFSEGLTKLRDLSVNRSTEIDLRLSTNKLPESYTLPIDEGILTISAGIWEDLIRFFIEHPLEIHKLPPRKFEEMVAELFERFGYNVELTSKTKDGGRDIIAIRFKEINVKYLT